MLLAAGCIGTGDDAPADAPEAQGEEETLDTNRADVNETEEAGEEPPLHTLDQEESLSFTSFRTPANWAVRGENCLKADDHGDLEILGGTIELTWDPIVPTSEELQLRLFESDNDLLGGGVGSSPLTVQIDAASIPSEANLTLVVDLPSDGPGVTVEQEADVSLTIDYQAQQTFSFQDGWACARN